jgi:Xaa-Pro aminopeptidase
VDANPFTPFPSDVFVARRRTLFERLGAASMVLPAAPHRRRSRDTDYPYRPDSELFWVTGITAPDAVAVLRGHADEQRFVVFVRERDPEAETWSGPRMGPERAREAYGADAAYPIGEMAARLPSLLNGSGSVAFRLEEDARGYDEVLEALRVARMRGGRRGTGPRAVVDPGEFLDDLRLRKDTHELDRMRAAARLTVAAFREVAPRLRAGTGEWEIQGLLDGAFRAGGGDGPAYETIVGSGPNACVLHYVRNDRRLLTGESVLIDAGASVGLYAADLTRTFPVDGRFTSAGRDVYQVVDEARRAAIEAVRPGARVSDVHEAAVAVIRDGLLELGLGPIETGAERDGSAARHATWFPHQTSHWLGLDVHDVGDYARGGESRVLEPGMVLTVEPGLYFPATADLSGRGAPADLAGIGVRIEDDILVTSDGHENLTSDFPTDPDEIAALVSG